MADLFWVNGAANNDWEDTDNWALSSGGAGGFGPPGATDTAIFDSAVTDNCVLISDATVSLAGLELRTGYTGTVSFPGAPGGGEPSITTGASGLYVTSGHLNMSASDFRIDKSDLTQNGGTITLSSNTTTFDDSSWTWNSGTLNHNSGTVLLMQSNVYTDQTIDIDGQSLYNVTYDMGSYAMEAAADFTVEGKLLVLSHRNFYGVYTITVKGDYETRSVSTSFGGESTLLFDGTGDQEFRSNNTSVERITGANLTINKASGTLYVIGCHKVRAQTCTVQYDAGDINWDDADCFTVQGHNGTVRCNATLTVNPTYFIVDCYAFDFYVDQGDLIVAGGFVSHGRGLKSSNNGALFLRGADNDIQNNGEDSMTLPITIDGTGDQTLRSSTDDGAISQIKINKASGTLTIQDTLAIRGDSTLSPQVEYVAGDVDASASTLRVMGNDDTTIKTGTMVLGNVTLETTSGLYDLVADGEVIIGGDLSIPSGTVAEMNAVNSGKISLRGDLSSADNDVSGDCPFELNGTGAQEINCANGEIGNGDLTINKASGVASLGETFSPASWLGSILLTLGTLDLAGFDATCVDFTVGASGTLKLKGDETLTISGVKTFSGSAIYYDQTVLATLNDLSASFVNLTLGADGKVHELDAEVTVSGVLDFSGDGGVKGVLQSDTPGTLRKLTLNGTCAGTDGIKAIDIDSRDGNQVEAIGSGVTNTFNWKTLSTPVSPVRSARIGRAGSRGRICRGVVEWT